MYCRGTILFGYIMIHSQFLVLNLTVKVRIKYLHNKAKVIQMAGINT